MRIWVFTILFSVTIATSCKPAGKDSESQSIEAIKSGESKNRHDKSVRCGTTAEIDPKESAAEAVRIVYDRLPASIRGLVQSTMAIDRKQDISQVCKAAVAGQADREGIISLLDESYKAGVNQAIDRSQDTFLEGLEACYIFEKAPQPKDAKGLPTTDKFIPIIPKIFIQDDVSSIHRNLLAITTYAVIDLYVDTWWGPIVDRVGLGQQAPTATLGVQETAGGLRAEERGALEYIVNFRNLRRSLADSMLLDLKGVNAAGQKEIIKKYELLKTRSPVLFGNFFLAEMVDTHYCNDATRATFTKADFPTAYPVWQQMLVYLE
jgi:hypothetical protein